MNSLILGWPLKSEATAQGDPTAFRHRKEPPRRDDLEKAIVYSEDGHLITFAPTGAGKGVSVIIPNLLNYDGPVITVDPKGENFSVTARYRKEVLGQEILLLDPFHAVPDAEIEKIGGSRGGLNPLDVTSDMRGALGSQAIMLADLIAGETVANDPFWDLEARKLIAGIIELLISSSVRRGKPVGFKDLVDPLFGGADADPPLALARMLDELHPSAFATMLVGNFLLMPHEGSSGQRGGVLSTAQSHFGAFIAEDTAPYLGRSSISLEDIANRDDYTIYIVIPPAKLASHAQLLRIWIGVLLSSIMERKRKPDKRTLFLLDECAQLGTMDALRKAVTLLRGYGLQVWMFFQDSSQLESLYPTDYPTLVNNCGVFQAFGSGRFSAAVPVARQIGGLSAKDLAAMDTSQQIVSIRGDRPKFCRLADYRTDPALMDRADPNFLFGSVSREKRRFGIVRRYAGAMR